MPSQLILNRDEIAIHLARVLMQKRFAKDDTPGRFIKKLRKQINTGLIKLDDGNFEERLMIAVREDLQDWRNRTRDFFKKNNRNLINLITKNLDKISDGFEPGEFNKLLIDVCMNNDDSSFVKRVGPAFVPYGEFITHFGDIDPAEVTVIRNILENETLLKTKMENKLPFWFIDSGYTNFLHTNKMWHRVIYNHVHQKPSKIYDTERLQNFSKFPKKWRTGGSAILIIEPSSYTCNLFDIDIAKWKKEVYETLSDLSDLKLEFKSKDSKKVRGNLYEELLDSDYACLVNYSSGAAVEAIWAGIPVITLGTHISNPVSRSSCKDINNLYRGPLADWLCMLSYSQFTFLELRDGTARRIIKEYHHA